MDRHVDLVAALLLLAAWLSGVVAATLAALALAATSLASDERVGLAARLTGAAFAILSALAALWAGAAATAGIALRRRQWWARRLGLLLGWLSLLFVPFGTALGIYTLWVLLNAEAGRLFARPQIS